MVLVYSHTLRYASTCLLKNGREMGCLVAYCHASVVGRVLQNGPQLSYQFFKEGMRPPI